MNFKADFLSKSPFLKGHKNPKASKKTKKYHKKNKRKFMCGPDGCKKEGEIEVEEVEVFEKQGKKKGSRCWPGYKPVKGKKAYSDGSCEPV